MSGREKDDPQISQMNADFKKRAIRYFLYLTRAFAMNGSKSCIEAPSPGLTEASYSLAVPLWLASVSPGEVVMIPNALLQDASNLRNLRNLRTKLFAFFT